MHPLLASQLAEVPYGVGLEWLVLVSILLPALLLIVLLYFGSKNTV
jgi:hypothetical protein